MKNDKDFERWVTGLPEWQKILGLIILSIIGVLLAVLAVFLPPILAFINFSLAPLLLWCIPAGVGVGIIVWSDMND